MLVTGYDIVDDAVFAAEEERNCWKKLRVCHDYLLLMASRAVRRMDEFERQ